MPTLLPARSLLYEVATAMVFSRRSLDGRTLGDRTGEKSRSEFLCLRLFRAVEHGGFPGIEQQDKTTVDRFTMLARLRFPKVNRKKGEWYPAVAPLCRPSTGFFLRGPSAEPW